MDLPNANRRITEQDIGIISPYRAQVRELRNTPFKAVLVGTTEAFQGSEKPIIIISTVRTDHQIGFLQNFRVSKSIYSRINC